MKGLSTKQPWASLISNGYKTIETRTRNISYRGPVLICSSKIPADFGTIKLIKHRPLFDDSISEIIQFQGHDFCNGHALAVAEIVDCRPMTKSDEDEALCQYPDDYYNGYIKSWVLKNIRKINPIPIKGHIFLFDIPEEIINSIVFV